MTPAAEKDIRSALRWLRACRGRLEMARTGKLSRRHRLLVDSMRTFTRVAEDDMLELLGYGRAVPRRKVRLKYPSGDVKGVF